MSKRSKRVRQEERNAQRELRVRRAVSGVVWEERIGMGRSLPELVEVDRARVVKVEHAANC